MFLPLATPLSFKRSVLKERWMSLSAASLLTNSSISPSEGGEAALQAAEKSGMRR